MPFLEIKDIYKNAFLMTMAHLPINLVLLVIILGIHCAVAVFLMRFNISILPIFLLLELFLGYGLVGFIANFRSEVMFKKYFKE